jgi:Tfp pilus assembly protein PilN
MIEINLLPGAARKTRSRMPSLSLGAALSGVRDRVRDPFMLSAVGAVVVAAAAIGALHMKQSSRVSELAEREERAVADSTRFAGIIRERERAEAKRDSVLRQLQVIRSIDEERYVWPHIMDEVSRALPPYTWLKSLGPSALTAAQPAPATTERKDPVPMTEPMRFRIVGNTVDIQALTRFMRLLEASPFVQNVQLAKSELAMVEGKEVTEFQLEAQYERPDKSVITTVPVSLSAR